MHRESHTQYTLTVKTATLPPVRVDHDLRLAAEQVLNEGESLSAFIETTVRRAVEFRQVQTEFVARGQKAIEAHRRTGLSHSVDDVADRLTVQLEARRKQLGL